MNLQEALAKKNARTPEKQGQGFLQSTVTDAVIQEFPRRKVMAYKHDATTYENAAKELDEATSRMESALQKLVACEKNTSVKAKEAVSRAKDTANQLGDALARVNRMLGYDFETRLAQLERLADAMTKLADLEKSGGLQSLVKVFGKGA